MREVGAQLRRARLERDEDLDEVAEYLRIRSAYLFGIEQGDLSPMPGRTYALGFLRSYADYLGFDGEDLIAQIKSSVEDLTDRTRFRIRSPLPESRLPKTPILVLSLAMIAGIYSGWSYLNRSSQMVIETVSEVPNSLRTLALESLPEDATETGPAAAPETVPWVAEPERSATPPDPTPEIASDSPGVLPGGADAALADAGSNAGVADPRAAAPADMPAARLGDARGGALPATPETGAEPEAGPAVGGKVGQAGGDATTSDRAALPPMAQGQPVAPAAADFEVARAGASPAAAGDGGNVEGATDPAGAVAPAGEVLARFLDPTVRAPKEAPQVYEAVNGDARVILRAREVSWIQVSSPSGDYLRALTLGPEESFLVPDRPDLELWTGNAGGLEIIVDGAPVAPLGAVGQVVRNVSLDPDRLRATPAPGTSGEAR